MTWEMIWSSPSPPGMTYKDTLLNAVLKKISEHVDTDHNVTVNQNGDWSNIGVVVKGNNEQSYIGVSIRIKNVNK